MKPSPFHCTVTAIFVALAPAAIAATFTVTNTNNGGINSLRWAIQQANSSPGSDLIDFNIPAFGSVPTISLTAPLPPLTDQTGSTTIDGFSQPTLAGAGPGTNPPATISVGVELDGSSIPPPAVGGNAHGIWIRSSDNIVQGLCVHSFPQDGISIQGVLENDGGSNNNRIQHNLVGTDISGTTSLPNCHDPNGLWAGIYVKVTPGSPVLSVARHNVIRENLSSGNGVQDTALQRGGGEGIGLASCPDCGDVADNEVLGNYVGTDISGMGPLSNYHTGVYIGEGAHDNRVGEDATGVAWPNVICANYYEGVSIVGWAEAEPAGLYTDENIVSHNLIGVNVAHYPLGNWMHGVAIGAYGGNADTLMVPPAQYPPPAYPWGYFGGHARYNRVAHNTIAHNNRCGVMIWEWGDAANQRINNASFNTITQNSIYENGNSDPGYLGIDLQFDGVTLNDPMDPDLGPNQFVNFPLDLMSVSYFGGGTATVSGLIDIDTTTNNARVEVFRVVPDSTGPPWDPSPSHGEGAFYLGTAVPDGFGNWSLSVSGVVPGDWITATTTDELGNTSEFAKNVAVEGDEEIDYGDADDPFYPTWKIRDGARHIIVPNWFISQAGTAPDGEGDGQPDPNALGDDNNGINDELDGAVFSLPLIPGLPNQLDVYPSQQGMIDAWVDFNADGDWSDSGEQIFASALVSAPWTSLTFNVPATAVPGVTTYARVRFSQNGGLSFTGTASEGEVEDHEVVIEDVELDWGDAPDSAAAPQYPTLAANNGANHLIVPGVYLGTMGDPDGEPDGQPDSAASGDDVGSLYGGIDDEDGVILLSPVTLGGSVDIRVEASVAGYLHGWVDFNQANAWNDADDLLCCDYFIPAGSTDLSFPVPASAVTGATYMRFRFTTNLTGGLSFDGPASEGEVEDYTLQIEDDGNGHKMHWVQWPDPEGWDIRGYEPKILADDFRCTASGAITEITFWGSWRDDVIQEPDHHYAFANLHLSFHGDLRPEGEHSRPGNLLWEWDIGMDQLSDLIIEGPFDGPQGWFDPNTGLVIPNDHNHYFKYTIKIPEEGEPFYQEEGTIYWLDIQVTTTDEAFEWGWKTSRSAHFEDDAVWADDPGGPAFDWFELIDPFTGESLDLAFMIKGESVEPKVDWGDAPDDAADPTDYPTWASSTGASHIIATDVAGNVIRLGPAIDPEPDGQPTAAADGDDTAGIVPDDEDGVTFQTSLIQGTMAWIDVEASVPGYLNAWIDYNGDNDWNEADEYVFIDTWLNAGTNSLLLAAVPPTAVTSRPTYARFRFTTQDFATVLMLDYSGQAPDGEVEDYEVQIVDAPEGVDFGDAPDPAYPTVLLSDGARHIIQPGYCMGAAVGGVDPEPDGQPDGSATGDDGDILYPPVNDDEDGVYFHPIISGQWGAMDVTATGPGFVDAWIDLNYDGFWSAGERIGPGAIPVNPGFNQIPLWIPTGTPSGMTYARVRFSSNDPLITGVTILPIGLAHDGEVEDYEVEILPEDIEVYDFGDAPDGTVIPPHPNGSYPTRGVDNGARHDVGAGPFVWLGGMPPDLESDGQPHIQALGDDIANLPDEDGWMGYDYPFIAGYPSLVGVFVDTPSASGLVDAWIDFNNNGIWEHPGEQVVASQFANNGQVTHFPIHVPPGAFGGFTFMRLRISSAGGLLPTGIAADGEVEDVEVFVYQEGELELDWGDAPDGPYPSWMASFGAAHSIDALYLGPSTYGSSIDPEIDGQPTLAADGDDNDGNNDDDGVDMDPDWISGYDVVFNVYASAAANPLNTVLYAWADFDNDGWWTGGVPEEIAAGVPLSPGDNSLTVAVPAGIGLSSVYTRFRINANGMGQTPTGYATGGEVEDYLVPVGVRIPATISVTWPPAPQIVTLAWTAPAGATNYSIYSSTTLAGPFPSGWTREASGLVGTSWTETLVGTPKFYIVVAFP